MLGMAVAFGAVGAFGIGIYLTALLMYPVYRWAGGRKSLARYLRDI